MSDENTPQGDPEALGDAGKAALVAERKRADDAEKALRAANTRLQQIEDSGKTELEKAQARVQELEAQVAAHADQIAEKERAIARLNVGIETGLPKNLIDRLQGDDEDALRADADSLRALIPDTTSDPFPKADPSQGARGAGKSTTADIFAEFAAKKLT